MAANEVHLNKLRAGAGAWNPWRKRHPRLRPVFTGENFIEADLSEADLHRARLDQVDFYRALLMEARLSRTNLRAADLTEADLTGADLRQANLGNARLHWARLHGADLSEANLSQANLSRADFSGASLVKTDFAHAWLDAAVFVDADMSHARHLDTCRFTGPCMLDQRTLAKSGALPVAFLRGCGLSDWEIETTRLYDSRLTPDQIVRIAEQISVQRRHDRLQRHNLFLLYDYRNADFIQTLEPHLDNHKIRFWSIAHDTPAEPHKALASEPVRSDPVVLLVLSQHSIEASWVATEIDQAQGLEGKWQRPVLYPIALDNHWQATRWSRTLLARLNRHTVLDFSRWRDPEQLERLAANLLEGLGLYD